MNKIDSYFEFIRYALNPKGNMPKDVAKMDWEGFFQFADEQGILGLMADGRRMMADEAGMRDDEVFFDDLTLEWGFVAQQIEEQNKFVLSQDMVETWMKSWRMLSWTIWTLTGMVRLSVGRLRGLCQS